MLTKYIDFRPRGSALDLFKARQDEVILAGPAGTGKSRGALERCNAIAEHYDGSRGLIARKTRASLTNTTLVTFSQLVLLPDRAEHLTYRGLDYPNGSRIDFGGLDKSSRIMSSEYDWVYVPEATELTESDWEALTTRLRWGVVPYQQLFADCNPAHPGHFIKRRANAGKLKMLESRHEDNPRLWSTYAKWWASLSPAEKKRPENLNLKPWEGLGWTPGGMKYIAKLDALSGPRYLRLRKGIWASAEGMVYESWDPAIHCVDRWLDEDEKIPLIKPHWTRIWCIDFGFTNPFVWQAWAIDPDGRMYRYREIYMTGRLVEDHARQILALCKAENEPKPAAIVCDHDAEDRATFERHVGMATVPAYKIVSPGIQAVQKRLRLAGDGKPTIFFLRDSLVEIDVELQDQRKPTCTEEEIESYVWPQYKEPTGESPKDQSRRADSPVKRDDHGCFVAGTLITTKRGLVPIESVMLSDEVLTRGGFRDVLAVGMTQRNAPILECTMTDGRALRGTRSHPILTAQKQFTYLDSLRYDDEVWTHELSGLRRRSRGSESGSVESFIGGTHNLQGSPKEVISPVALETVARDLADSTGIYGLPGMDQFRMVTRSTTKMETLSATSVETLNVSPRGSTKNAIGQKPVRAVDLKNIWLTISRASHWQESVISARLTSDQWDGGSLTDSALTPVNQNGGVTLESMTSPESAKRAGSSSPSINIPSNGFAGVRVLTVRDLGRREDVFNIQVEGDPEYFANGVLVHNCDTTRYAAAAVGRIWEDPSAGPGDLEVGSVAGYRISTV